MLRVFGLPLLLWLTACVPQHAVQSFGSVPSDAREDFVYLLETLDDGKLAEWQDSRGSQHAFAVFSTYVSRERVCRDYFHIINTGSYAKHRRFGTSCRIGKLAWQHVQGSEVESEKHYQRFLQLDAEFKQPQRQHPTPPPVQQHTASPRSIAYPSTYTLSPFFIEHAQTAEKKYRIPLRQMINDVSKQQNFHPCFIHSVVFYESGYNPNAASPCCVGLMQLGKAAAKESGVTNRRDPRQSLQGGARYLHLKMNERGINGNVGLALASYNCGYGTIKKNNFKIPQRCWSNKPQQYVEKILSKYKQCQ